MEFQVTHTIVSKRSIAEQTYYLEVRAPFIAEARKPGQFVMLQLDTDIGERIPLTIAGADPKAGTISLIFQTVGKTTHDLAELPEGSAIANLVGPLGTPTEIESYGTVVCVGGGIGVAPLFPIAHGLKQAGNRIIGIIGARSREHLILEEEMASVSDELITCTDDGSYRRKGYVSAPLVEVCEREPPPDLAVVVGPPAMMRVCCEATRPFGVRTIASLNTIMVDGTGMCGGCRVTVGGETRFACVDGPEFDGHQVDFANLMKRLDAYKGHEDKAHAQCHLARAVTERQESAR